jgi:hypothetical protein
MNRFRKAFVGVALAGSALVGGAVGATLLSPASAQTATSSTTAPATQQAPGPGAPGGRHDPAMGGHVGQNGVKEELLTGDTAEKVKAAALAANPGGTVERVETDAEGSPYEAHMTTADGSHITVKVDASFNVTSTEDGPH